MIYLWSLHSKQDLPWFADRSRVETAMKELQRGYQQHFAGEEVSVLGGQVIEQRLPTGPDEFVVATSLMVCKKNSIPFKSGRDEISYSVDQLDGRSVGVCRIQVQARPKPWWQVWKWLWIGVAALLILSTLYWFYSDHLREIQKEAETRGIEQEIAEVRNLPKKTIKITLEKVEGSDRTFPFLARVVAFLGLAGFTVVQECLKPCDSTMHVRVKLDVRSGSYQSRATGEISTRYTGATLAGSLQFQVADRQPVTKHFEGDKPLETMITGGYANPSEAPLLEIYMEHVAPKIADLLGAAYGPDPLIRALRTTDDEWTRRVCARALIRGGNRSVSALLGTLESKHPRARIFAAFALGEIGEQVAVASLGKFLKSPDEDFKLAVASALAKLGNPRGLDTLVQFLSHSESHFRSEAARSLGDSGNPGAVVPLIAVLKSKDTFTSMAARVALTTLTEKDFGDDDKKWQDWWSKNKTEFRLKR